MWLQELFAENGSINTHCLVSKAQLHPQFASQDYFPSHALCLAAERRERCENVDGNAVQGKQQIARSGHSCVSCLRPTETCP